MTINENTIGKEAPISSQKNSKDSAPSLTGKKDCESGLNVFTVKASTVEAYRSKEQHHKAVQVPSINIKTEGSSGEVESFSLFCADKTAIQSIETQYNILGRPVRLYTLNGHSYIKQTKKEATVEVKPGKIGKVIEAGSYKTNPEKVAPIYFANRSIAPRAEGAEKISSIEDVEHKIAELKRITARELEALENARVSISSKSNVVVMTEEDYSILQSTGIELKRITAYDVSIGACTETTETVETAREVRSDEIRNIKEATADKREKVSVRIPFFTTSKSTKVEEESEIVAFTPGVAKEVEGNVEEVTQAQIAAIKKLASKNVVEAPAFKLVADKPFEKTYKTSKSIIGENCPRTITLNKSVVKTLALGETNPFDAQSAPTMMNGGSSLDLASLGSEGRRADKLVVDVRTGSLDEETAQKASYKAGKNTANTGRGA